jgi:transcriptional regulator with XRE-family HTH domain
MPKKVKPAFAFGERLSRLRSERGLTQTELAERIGSTQRCISAYETIAEYPPTAALVAIAEELKISTDELLGRKPLPKLPANDDAPEARKLWKTFRKVLSLPERDRKAVVRLVNSLVGAVEA